MFVIMGDFFGILVVEGFMIVVVFVEYGFLG